MLYFMLRHYHCFEDMAEKNIANSDNLIECKRLFVGGLYNGVSKNELSLKFKPFGNVKDLEIICRHDAGSGDHIKTFAYLDIDMTEKKFRKCLSTYNKCNWKGHVLKVEVAKEDYLTRLQKEKTANISLDHTKERQDTELPVSDIKSAVPGTLVPNRQNWVIGKFGRALPIMFLRRKNGKKIAKFDPSKTVHCLKRLGENNNRQDCSIHNLTWNLSDSDPILNSVSTNTVSVNQLVQAIEEPNYSYMANHKTRTEKSHSNFKDTDSSANSVTQDSDCTEGGLLSCNNSMEKNNGESFSSHSFNQSVDNDKIRKTSYFGNDIQMSDEGSCCSDECSTFSDFETHLDTKQSTNDQYQPNAAARSQSKPKEISNKVRLKTLEERKEVLKNQKQVVKNALQKIDVGFVTGGNHIVFESYENQTEKNLNLSNGGKKITGSQALAWLGMDSSSDEEDKKIDDFFGKEHFDGKSGEKLMKLQHKFGHDERFKMDGRFLESDDEMESLSKTSLIEEDDLNNELKEEKLLSLKVLQDVLGTNSGFVEENEDARNLYRDSVDTRYDPTRKDHAKFEEEIKRSKCPVEKNENNTTEDVPAANEHVATQEKFYTVSDSLKGFFSYNDKKNSTFSFFPEMDEKKDNHESVTETKTITGWKAPVKTTQALPYDSSASESGDDIGQSTSDLASSTVLMKNCLFYRADDQRMMDALQAESSNFMRKESVENLTRYWVEVRQKMTQSYKQKRKDALRRQKRTSYRRTKH